MIDWNGDGRCDNKDHAFYNNVLSGDKSNGTSNANKKIATNTNKKYKTTGQQPCQSASSKGWGWFALACFVYFVFKLVF